MTDLTLRESVTMVLKAALENSEDKPIQYRITLLEAISSVCIGLGDSKTADSALEVAAFLRSADEQQLKFKNLL